MTGVVPLIFLMYIKYTFLSSLSLVTNNEKLQCSTTIYLYDIHYNITLSYTFVCLLKWFHKGKEHAEKKLNKLFVPIDLVYQCL